MLTVTDDLPTPPLPDEMPSTRVFDPASAKGMALPGRDPWAPVAVAVRRPPPPPMRARTAARSSSVITVMSTVDVLDAVERHERVRDPVR